MANLSTAPAAGNPETPGAAPAGREPAPERQPQRSRGLAHKLVEGIGQQIRSQALRPGCKLPTESEIIKA